jgi:four helix bundle protein
MSIKQFEELEIWQLARKLTVEICRLDFSRNHSLAYQIRRAAISIMSNITEGFERDGNQEFVQFLYIAKGSCGEVRCQLYIALDLGVIDENKTELLMDLARTISRKIAALIKHLRTSGMKGIKYKAEDKYKKYQEDLMRIYNESIKA